MEFKSARKSSPASKGIIFILLILSISTCGTAADFTVTMPEYSAEIKNGTINLEFNGKPFLDGLGAFCIQSEGKNNWLWAGKANEEKNSKDLKVYSWEKKNKFGGIEVQFKAGASFFPDKIEYVMEYKCNGNNGGRLYSWMNICKNNIECLQGKIFLADGKKMMVPASLPEKRGFLAAKFTSLTFPFKDRMIQMNFDLSPSQSTDFYSSKKKRATLSFCDKSKTSGKVSLTIKFMPLDKELFGHKKKLSTRQINALSTVFVLADFEKAPCMHGISVSSSWDAPENYKEPEIRIDRKIGALEAKFYDMKKGWQYLGIIPPREGQKRGGGEGIPEDCDQISIWMKGDGSDNALDFVMWQKGGGAHFLGKKISLKDKNWHEVIIKMSDFKHHFGTPVAFDKRKAGQFQLRVNKKCSFGIKRIAFENTSKPLRIQSLKPRSWIFKNGKQVIVNIDIYSMTQKKADLSCVVSDYYGKIIKKQKINLDLSKGITKIKQPFDIKDFGYYDVKVELPGGESAISSFCNLRSLEDGKTNESVGIANVDCADFPTVAEIGVKWVRVGEIYGVLSWPRVEPEKDSFSWEDADRTAEMAQKYGISLLAILGETPPWAASVPPGPSAHKSWKTNLYQGRRLYPPKDIKDWNNYVSAVVNRYKGKIKYWEIWNEPDWHHVKDGPTFFCGTAREYFEMLKGAYTTAKNIDPECKIVTGGMGLESHDKNFIEDLMKMGAGNYFDIIGFHRYCSWAVFMEQCEIITKEFNFPKPIWQTERQFKTHSIEKEKQQPAKYIQDYLIAMSKGIEKYFLFAFRGGLGCIVHLDHSPRPVVASLNTLVTVLSDAEFSSKINLGNEDICAFCFKKKGNPIFALWNNGGGKSFALETASENVKIIDGVGYERTLLPENGKISLELGELPIFIIGAKQLALLGADDILLDIDLSSNGGKLDIDVELERIKGTDRSGRLALTSLPPELCIKTASGKFEGLEKYKKRKMIFPVEKLTGSIENENIIALVETKNGYFKKARRLDLLKCGRKNNDIKLDGNLSEWRNSYSPIHLRNPAQVTSGKEKRSGNEDLSAIAYSSWDNEFMYFAVKVNDENIMHKYQEKFPYNGDSVELFFDFRKNADKNEGYSEGAMQVYVSPMADGNGKIYCAKFEKGQFAKENIEGKSLKTDKGYTLEFKIPFKWFTDRKMEAGNIIGFDIGLDDADKDKRESQMVWAGTKDNYNDVSNFGKMIFTD